MSYNQLEWRDLPNKCEVETTAKDMDRFKDAIKVGKNWKKVEFPQQPEVRRLRGLMKKQRGQCSGLHDYTFDKDIKPNLQ